ncbi:MAG: CCA tRNA nucleotidyltransferase [Erysipelotrichaceae bacterium]|nr:CCA tRNA nucleotidyltransferase [Erysipelotrichaceae bacterium]
MKLNKQVKTVLSLLNENGYEAYLVGGAVRNILLKRKIEDYDVTTDADPNAIRMLFNNYRTYDIGKKHGTITVLIDSEKIEITPFRREDKYSDHRHPDKVEFTGNLKDDLKRRDFTINAMCLDRNGDLVDYFGGLEDLNNKLIRCIGDPNTRFNEDALRILRAIRFKVKLGFEIEKETDKAVFECKDLLKYISAERKKEELLKILNTKDGFKAINDYLEVFNTFMPFKKCERKINNFTSSLYALAYLLRDCECDLKELKYSKEEINLIKALIHASDIDINDDYQFISCLSSIYQKQLLEYLEQLHHRDLKDRYKKLKRYMVMLNDLKISGEEIESYGYKAKQIGKVKNELLELVHQKKLHNTSASLHKQLQKNIL